MTSIAVVGSEGFLGSALVRHLEAAGERVIRVDVVDKPGVRRSLDEPVDVVFNLAGKLFGTPEQMHEAHVATTQRLLDGGHGVVVLASSQSVYGPIAEPAREDMPLDPRGDYARSKAAADELALASAVDVRIARISNPYGPGQRRMVLPDLAEKALAGHLEVRGDGSDLRDFIHVDDLARALILIATAGERGVYNVGSGEVVAIIDIARRIAAWAGLPESQIRTEHEPGEQPFSISNPALDRLVALGYQPLVPLSEGLAGTLESIRSSA